MEMSAPAMKPEKHYVKYVPGGYADTHSMAIGYLFWIVGFTGAHRFYYGRPISGVIWFFTLGLLGIGWIIDAFLIPGMDREADLRYHPGKIDYNLSWIFLLFLGWAGFHRFYQGKIITGLIFLFTGGIFGIGIIYDLLCFNEQISDQNAREQAHYAW